MRPFVESIEDLKANREEIIAEIKEQAETNDMGFVKKVMKQIMELVTASNYGDLDYDIYETIEHSISDVQRMTESTPSVDMGEINRRNALANLPSSMR